MTVHLIHGFNVFDGGRGTVGKLQPYIRGAEVSHDYGWTGLLKLHRTNKRAIDTISAKVKPGDFIIGHSNAAWIIYEIAHQNPGLLGGVVLINPALRRDLLWPKKLPVLCLYNEKDWVVQAGLFWSYISEMFRYDDHLWGAAGKYGFNQTRSHQPLVRNINTSDDWWIERATGHSGVFKAGAVEYWGKIIDSWMYHLKGFDKK